MIKTSFFRVILVVFLCSAFALCYVHQQTEIIKAGFQINSKRHEISFLLDQYRSLVYNLSRLESPGKIKETLCVNEITLCMPKMENIHRVEGMSAAYRGENHAPDTKETLLAFIFDRFSTKAEAKVVDNKGGF
ncbi:MAG: hypothetical protein JW994_03920 [Candidatus Omnitrophica bacterium]|nr:hypothetical protein [Candidatus Omnitrophota bacterium]